MATKRAHRLIFKGADAHGIVQRFWVGYPARDLEAGEVEALTDAEYANLTGGADPVYVPEEPAAAPKAASPAKAAGGEG